MGKRASFARGNQPGRISSTNEGENVTAGARGGGLCAPHGACLLALARQTALGVHTSTGRIGSAQHVTHFTTEKGMQGSTSTTRRTLNTVALDERKQHAVGRAAPGPGAKPAPTPDAVSCFGCQLPPLRSQHSILVQVSPSSRCIEPAAAAHCVPVFVLVLTHSHRRPPRHSRDSAAPPGRPTVPFLTDDTDPTTRAPG